MKPKIAKNKFVDKIGIEWSAQDLQELINACNGFKKFIRLMDFWHED